jgi:hypothetical protein
MGSIRQNAMIRDRIQAKDRTGMLSMALPATESFLRSARLLTRKIGRFHR